jgi:hypothetical protein
MKDLVLFWQQKEHEQECSRMHRIDARREDAGCSSRGLVTWSKTRVAGVRVAVFFTLQEGSYKRQRQNALVLEQHSSHA